MSYGLTPSDPTIPSAMTLPGMQVDARSNKTPTTGATSSPRCTVLTVHRDSLDAWREEPNRLERALGTGIGIGKGYITKTSMMSRYPHCQTKWEDPGIGKGRQGEEFDLLTTMNTINVTMDRASTSLVSSMAIRVLMRCLDHNHGTAYVQ
jgi:hypothetical protein